METASGIELVVDCVVDDMVGLGNILDVPDDIILAEDDVDIGDLVVDCKLVVALVVLIVVSGCNVPLVTVSGINGIFIVVCILCAVDKRGRFDIEDVVE